MRFAVITLFEAQVQSVVAGGVVGRAAERGLMSLECINPRDYSDNSHRRVDDRPFGGGPGMVMSYQPLRRSIDVAKERLGVQARVIGLTPQGKPFQQNDAERLARLPALVLVAGRYEGMDERVAETRFDEELSIGDYVLSGGEIAATVIVDAVTRLLPGVLGDADSASQDSFSDGLLDCPHYTRPEEIDGMAVPPVLLGGDHAKIARWRRKQALGRTWLRRPDLIERQELTADDAQLLQEFLAESSGSVCIEND